MSTDLPLLPGAANATRLKQGGGAAPLHASTSTTSRYAALSWLELVACVWRCYCMWPSSSLLRFRRLWGDTAAIRFPLNFQYTPSFPASASAVVAGAGLAAAFPEGQGTHEACRRTRVLAHISTQKPIQILKSPPTERAPFHLLLSSLSLLFATCLYTLNYHAIMTDEQHDAPLLSATNAAVLRESWALLQKDAEVPVIAMLDFLKRAPGAAALFESHGSAFQSRKIASTADARPRSHRGLSGAPAVAWHQDSARAG